MESSPLPSIPSTERSQGSELALLTPQPERRPNRRFAGVTWIPIDHRANLRRGSKVSEIWLHGDDYMNPNDPLGSHRWVCNRCRKAIKVPRSKSSSNVCCHLLKAHRIRLSEADSSEYKEEEEEEKEINN